MPTRVCLSLDEPRHVSMAFVVVVCLGACVLGSVQAQDVKDVAKPEGKGSPERQPFNVGVGAATSDDPFAIFAFWLIGETDTLRMAARLAEDYSREGFIRERAAGPMEVPPPPNADGQDEKNAFSKSVDILFPDFDVITESPTGASGQSDQTVPSVAIDGLSRPIQFRATPVGKSALDSGFGNLLRPKNSSFKYADVIFDLVDKFAVDIPSKITVYPHSGDNASEQVVTIELEIPDAVDPWGGVSEGPVPFYDDDGIVTGALLPRSGEPTPDYNVYHRAITIPRDALPNDFFTEAMRDHKANGYLGGQPPSSSPHGVVISPETGSVVGASDVQAWKEKNDQLTEAARDVDAADSTTPVSDSPVIRSYGGSSDSFGGSGGRLSIELERAAVSVSPVNRSDGGSDESFGGSGGSVSIEGPDPTALDLRLQSNVTVEKGGPQVKYINQLVDLQPPAETLLDSPTHGSLTTVRIRLPKSPSDGDQTVTVEFRALHDNDELLDIHSAWNAGYAIRTAIEEGRNEVTTLDPPLTSERTSDAVQIPTNKLPDDFQDELKRAFKQRFPNAKVPSSFAGLTVDVSASTGEITMILGSSDRILFDAQFPDKEIAWDLAKQVESEPVEATDAPFKRLADRGVSEGDAWQLGEADQIMKIENLRRKHVLPNSGRNQRPAPPDLIPDADDVEIIGPDGQPFQFDDSETAAFNAQTMKEWRRRASLATQENQRPSPSQSSLADSSPDVARVNASLDLFFWFGPSLTSSVAPPLTLDDPLGSEDDDEPDDLGDVDYFADSSSVLPLDGSVPANQRTTTSQTKPGAPIAERRSKPTALTDEEVRRRWERAGYRIHEHSWFVPKGSTGPLPQNPTTEEDAWAVLHSQRIKSSQKAALLGVSPVELREAMRLPGGVEELVHRRFGMGNFDLYEISGTTLAPPKRLVPPTPPHNVSEGEGEIPTLHRPLGVDLATPSVSLGGAYEYLGLGKKGLQGGAQIVREESARLYDELLRLDHSKYQNSIVTVSNVFVRRQGKDYVVSFVYPKVVDGGQSVAGIWVSTLSVSADSNLGRSIEGYLKLGPRHLAEISRDVKETTGVEINVTPRDRRHIGRVQQPSSLRASVNGIDQWGLARIGLTRGIHQRLLAATNVAQCRRQLMFQVLYLLQRGSDDQRQLLQDVHDEPMLTAGDKAVLTGLINDLRYGRRSLSGDFWRSRSSVRETGPETPVIAVIDTGVDLAHPDLWGRLWRNVNEVPHNGVDDDQNGFVDDVFGYNFAAENADVTDDCGHGTHVAGIIAARHDNGGVLGVSPHARLMILKAADSEGKLTPVALVRAIHYAVKNGAKIIHMSLGIAGPGGLEKSVVEWARRQDVLMVAASGSEGNNTAEFSPACLPGVLTVGASTKNDQCAPLSGVGSHLDLVAPGVDVLSLRAANTNFLRRLGGPSSEQFDGAVVGGRWYRAGGTSFSAPFVTGAASLILRRSPHRTTEQIKRMILMSCDDVELPGWDRQTGAGVLNVRRALAEDPDGFVETRITEVRAAAGKRTAKLQVLGTAAADAFRTRRLDLAFGNPPNADAWKLLHEGTTPVKDGLLGDVTGRLLNRRGEWTIRSTVIDARGKRRLSTMVIAIK